MPTIQVIPGSEELQAIADTLGKSRKVVVVTGAGISTNCGIPDFRSENGLYSLIQAQFDAAAKNPPWEETNTHDIDDRPKKRRKPWYFYEVVAPCGQVVDTVGGGVAEDLQVTPNASFPNSTSTQSSRSRSASVSRPPSTFQSNPSGLHDLLDTPPDLDEGFGKDGDLEAPQISFLQPKNQLSPKLRSESSSNSHELPQGDPLGSSDLSDPPSDFGEAPWFSYESRETQELPRLRPGSLTNPNTNSPTNISDSSDLSDPPSDIGEITWSSSAIQTVSLDVNPPLFTNPRRSSRRHPDLLTRQASIDAIDLSLDLLQPTPSTYDPVNTTTSSANVSVNNTNSKTTPRLSCCSPSPAKQLHFSSNPASGPQLSQPQLPSSPRSTRVLRRESSNTSVSLSSAPSRQRTLLPTTTSQLPQPSITTSQSPAASRTVQVLQREDSSFVSINSDEVEPSTQSSQVSRTSLPNLKGRDLFDSMIWSDAQTTSIFYMFISSLRQKILEVKDTTETHKFIRILRDGGRLVRNYTQNIDCLEEREGLVTEISRGPGNRSRFAPKTQREARPSEISGDSPHNGGVECVYLHGGLDSLRCGICSRLSEWDEVRGRLTIEGRAPDCPFCLEAHEKRTGRGRRGLAVGRLRPDIVLYGEEHPQAALVSPLVTHDLGLGPDVLLIMGTSLRVHGLKVMVREFAKAIHSRGGKVVFVNRTKPSESVWGDVIDYWVEWDCDEWVVDLRERRGDIWLPQGVVEERRESIGDVKSRKGSDLDPSQPKKKKYEAPRCTRDEKTNGVYQTFKILDTLRSLEDEHGQSSRRQYWVTRYSTSSSTSKSKASGAQLPTTKAPRKSLPSKAQPSITASRVNKRKCLPALAPAPVLAFSEDQTRFDAELAKQATWYDIRKKFPSGNLSEFPPDISHTILQAPHSNIPWLKPNPTHPQKLDWNAFPDLLTHPPVIHPSPRTDQYIQCAIQSIPQPIQPIPRLRPSHSYGTRASRIEGPLVFASTEGNHQPLKPFAAQRVMTLETSIENRIPTPPESDPQTPVTNRDMSVGAMLSSEKDDNESFKSVREHSTREGTEDMDSVDMVGAQLWHDTVESMEH